MAKQAEKEKVILEAVRRTEVGKQAASSLRREGWVPAVVYGETAGSVPLHVAARELSRALHTKAGGNVLICLQVKEDSPPQKLADPPRSMADKKQGENLVLIRELQYHPVSHQIIHVDFHRVSLTKRITVTVPLAFKGEALGVKTSGGILEHTRWDLEVECLPTEIPTEIPVEVSTLDLGQTLAAKAIALPAGVRLVTDPEQPVVACVKPKEEAAAPAAAEEAAPTEPEVLKQKKPEELAEEEAAKEKGKQGREGKEGKEAKEEKKA